MDLGIDDRTALVTGGSKGIGKSVAEALTREGCRVAICARGQDELATATDVITDIDGDTNEPLAVQADITEDEDVSRLVETVVDEFGSIDILINNVGRTGPFEDFHEVSQEEWEEVFETNVKGTARVTREVLPHMREQEWGRIVNVASDAGIMPHAEMPQYNASKAAMINVTRSLARTYGEEGILVNAVAPTTTKTPLVESMFKEMAEANNITPEEAESQFLAEEKPQIVFDRTAEPEEVADVITFLASERASFVTGSTYRVDGGAIGSIGT